MYNGNLDAQRSAVGKQTPGRHRKVAGAVERDDSAYSSEAYVTAPQSQDYETAPEYDRYENGHEGSDDSEGDDQVDSTLSPPSESWVILPCCPSGLRSDNALWVKGQSVSDRPVLLHFGTASIKSVPRWRTRECTYWV